MGELQTLYRLQRCFFGNMDVMLDPHTQNRYLCQCVSEQEMQEFDPATAKQFEDYMSRMKDLLGVEHILAPIRVSFKELKPRYILFDYPNSITVYERLQIRGKSFPEETVRSIVKQVVRFFFSSERFGGCHHHDLKLENLYYHDNVVLVGGLDMAEWGTEDSTRIAGSMCNLAPEVHQNLAEAGLKSQMNKYDRKSDIYSLGVLTIELLACRNLMNVQDDENPILSMFISERVSCNKMQAISSSLAKLKVTMKDQSFYSLLCSMLEPDPLDRCNFNFLYEYFGMMDKLKKSSSYSQDTLASDPRLEIFSDPSLMKVVHLRQLFFARLNHEYKIVQFLTYVSRHFWNLMLFDLRSLVENKAQISEIRLCLGQVSTALQLKAQALRRNIIRGVKLKLNIFIIDELDLYFRHPIFMSDRSYIINMMEFDQGTKVRRHLEDTQAFADLVLTELPQQTTMLKSYSSLKGSRAQKLTFLNQLLLRLHNKLAGLKLHAFGIMFEGHIKMLWDCCRDQTVFKFADSMKGLFKWDSYMSENYGDTLAKLVFKTFGLSDQITKSTIK